MAKAKNSEVAKPKYQQTKLCFSSFGAPNITKKDSDIAKQNLGDFTKKLEKSIQDLNIGVKNQSEEHPDPCKRCSKYIKRIKCTAINPDTQTQCPLSFCEECTVAKVQENLEWIANNNHAKFVNKNGKKIEHIDTKSVKWACLVCRNICDCKLCLKRSQSKSGPKLSFNIEPGNKKEETVIHPPVLTPIKLLYSEEEIWIRLQIREFIFRFGDIYGFENRLLTSLQNVQGDWRIKKFGAYIVWKFLTIMYNTSSFEYLQEKEEESIPVAARKILNDWITDKKLDNLYYDREGKHNAILDVLMSEGMTGQRWQAIAELLSIAEFRDIPVPTTRDIVQKEKNQKNDNSEEDLMDIDEDEEKEEFAHQIQKYQKSKNRNLISSEDEIKMINMLLELLLYDNQIRQSLLAAGKNTMTKELRDEALEFKKYQKDWTQENQVNISNRTSLANRINLLQATKGKEKELRQARVDLDTLETLIRDENQNLFRKKLELIIHTQKAEKRMRPLGYDMRGNEYWMFNDIMDHLNNAAGFRNSEPYWAYGLIIIGPGYSDSEESQWWSIHGKENLKLLKNWTNYESKKAGDHQDDMKKITYGINERIDYLVSLENVIYGEGFFQ